MTTVIFDGNNTAYRSNSVMELSTKDGRRTSAIYGVLNSIPNVIRELSSHKIGVETSEILVAWDYGKNKRRMTLYPDYKKGRHHEDTEDRKKWYQDFLTQINTLHDFLPCLGVKTIRLPGQEADDLIYTYIAIANQLRYQEQNQFVIVSTDEDFLQLVSPFTSVYSPIKHIFYNWDNFHDLMGIQPNQFMDYKILVGDTSDHIKGIRGIGEVTGFSLIKKYGSIGGLLSSSDPTLRKSKVTSRIFTPEGLETLDRNNRLINLVDYVDIEEARETAEVTVREQPSISDKSVKKFLMEYQLSSLLVKYKEWIRVFRQVNDAYYS